MIEYKRHKTPLELKEYLEMLQDMGKEDYIWQQDKFGFSIFYKKVTKTNNQTIGDKNKEWLEFRTLYKKIKDNGLSANTLIVKYNKLTKQGLHKSIMENLNDYILYLQVTKKQKYGLMAQTYLNQERYKDKWELEEDFSKRFIHNIYKEKELNKDEIDYINNEIYVYEKKHSKEITDGVTRIMINKLLNK